MKLGMILVLFILLVIIAQIFCSSARENYESSSIQGSKGFNVYNRTTDLRLESTELTGDFESPVPPPHIIPPGGSYNFQVVGPVYGNRSAEAKYNVISPSNLIVGSVTITMKVISIYLPSPTSTTVTTEGPVSSQNGSTWVTIR
ncbi:hypothetical protein M3223_01715 [Paenibacillus pasadenensis]|uniref:hypothetical protein n=1 Tax=Paenibacillus pasadenensis TaxID=217090 RepID=UPI0020412227|nr:hypothetical protein [Paenibacillus pasadenensis]MCM3746065.1 hypothetical protein [Paenibacillus pasadenensis]